MLQVVLQVVFFDNTDVKTWYSVMSSRDECYHLVYHTAVTRCFHPLLEGNNDVVILCTCILYVQYSYHLRVCSSGKHFVVIW